MGASLWRFSRLGGDSGVDPDLTGGIISHLGWENSSSSPRRSWKAFLGREMSGKHNAEGEEDKGWMVLLSFI